MNEFIKYLITKLVSQPTEVEIEEIPENGVVIYKVTVADEDMGLIIGKEGRTIKSIRSLVRAKAIKDGVRVQIELVDKLRTGPNDH